MTPFLKVGHVRLGTVSWVEHDLIVVHLIGDHCRDGGGISASADVLTIATTSSGGVMGINTAGCNLGRDRSHIVIPGKLRYGTIVAMDIVRVEDALIVVRRDGGRGWCRSSR